MSKLDEIVKKAKEKAADVAEQAKNYDYKGKAEELKTKAADVAEKAKNYDYKGKAEELKEKAVDIADKAKDYDYKEKAKEMSEKVKNFDYEGKAKEVADTVKNYDYKGEVENIKKGGLKYFWNKHKKLSIGIVAVLFIIISFSIVGNNISKQNDNKSSRTKIVYANLPDEEIYAMLNEIFVDGNGYLGRVGDAILNTVNIGDSNYKLTCEVVDDNKYKITVSGNFKVAVIERYYIMSYIFDKTTQSGYLTSGDETPLIMYATDN